ncbi:MAG: DUF3990 domain-containing protein [Oscillospiraceae bacterium]|jgi:hypothetical protein|nr:DUF3990 domain-containing protein [Oscillospiraceae bacterium]
MKLYHGSNTEIFTIDLSKCKPYKDFGTGFYLTTLPSQAERMAARTARIFGGEPIVTRFEYSGNTDGLSVKHFPKPSEDWAHFVINNRNRNFADFSSPDCNHDAKYDIVIGAVANDDLVLLFRQFENGLIGIDTLKNEMIYKELTDQYSFHTERALALLKSEGVYRG